MRGHSSRFKAMPLVLIALVLAALVLLWRTAGVAALIAAPALWLVAMGIDRARRPDPLGGRGSTDDRPHR